MCGSLPFVAPRYDGAEKAVKKCRELQTILGLYRINGRGSYNPDSIARSSWKRVSSLLANEITKRTRPWVEVSA